MGAFRMADRWSKKDREYLRKNYDPNKKEELTNHLGRSWDAIIQQASKMGVTTPYHYVGSWSEEEDMCLFMMKDSSISEISELLGRSHSVISHRRSVIHISQKMDPFSIIKRRQFKYKVEVERGVCDGV